jgi:hypothetical protein
MTVISDRRRSGSPASIARITGPLNQDLGGALADGWVKPGHDG